MAYEFLLDPIVKYYNYFGKFPLEVVGQKRGGEWRFSTIQNAKKLTISLPSYKTLLETFGNYQNVKIAVKKVLEKSPERGRVGSSSENLKSMLLEELNVFYDVYRRYPKDARGGCWAMQEKVLAEQANISLSPCPVYCRYYGSVSKAREAALKFRIANNMIIYRGAEQLAIRW